MTPDTTATLPPVSRQSTRRLRPAALAVQVVAAGEGAGRLLRLHVVLRRQVRVEGEGDVVPERPVQLGRAGQRGGLPLACVRCRRSGGAGRRAGRTRRAARRRVRRSSYAGSSRSLPQVAVRTVTTSRRGAPAHRAADVHPASAARRGPARAARDDRTLRPRARNESPPTARGRNGSLTGAQRLRLVRPSPPTVPSIRPPNPLSHAVRTHRCAPPCSRAPAAPAPSPRTSRSSTRPRAAPPPPAPGCWPRPRCS